MRAGQINVHKKSIFQWMQCILTFCTKYNAEAVHQTQVIPVKILRDKVTSWWKQIFTNTKVPTQMHPKTANIPLSSMKAKDWQIVDNFCFIPIALDIHGSE